MLQTVSDLNSSWFFSMFFDLLILSTTVTTNIIHNSLMLIRQRVSTKVGFWEAKTCRGHLNSQFVLIILETQVAP